MGVSVTLVIFVGFLCLQHNSVCSKDIHDDVETELLTTLAEAARMVKPGSRALKYESTRQCMYHVKYLNRHGVDDGEKLSACLAECIVGQDQYGKTIFNTNTVPDKECLLTEESTRETALGHMLKEKKWKVFKKIGAWFKKNKDKIKKGLIIAGKIIKGIVGLFGRK